LRFSAVDALGDVAPMTPPAVDIARHSVSSNSDLSRMYFSHVLAGLIGDPAGLEYWTLVDTDDDPMTGGGHMALKALGFPSGPCLFGGIELVARAGDFGGEFEEPQAQIWRYDAGSDSFLPLMDAGLGASRARMLATLDDLDGGLSVPTFDIVTVQFDPIALMLSTPFRVYAAANRLAGEIDYLPDDSQNCTLPLVSLTAPVYPLCQVIPGRAPPGGVALVEATGLVPNQIAKVFLGDEFVGMGPIDETGRVAVAFDVPADSPEGNRLVTVGVMTTALTADCALEVVSSEELVIACPKDAEIPCGDSTDPGETGRATAFTKLCEDGVVEVNHVDAEVPGECPLVRSIRRVWYASDDCGNSDSCLQTINLRDTDDPTPVGGCPSEDITVECGDEVPSFDPGFVDSCDGDLDFHAISTIGLGECPPIWRTISRSKSATDECGNVGSCGQLVYIRDTTPPSLACPTLLQVQCTSPFGFRVDDLYLATSASDACSDVTITDDRSGSHYPPTCGGPPNRVTFTAIDDCGHESTCTTDVAVVGPMCCPVRMDGELALLPGNLDLRQETSGPVTTKARFDIWNQNEVRFSGTERCVTCWDQELLSRYDAPNHFRLPSLHTDKGRARIDGVTGGSCDPAGVPSALLGVSVKELTYDGLSRVPMRAGSTLVGTGTESATIRYDASGGSEELSDADAAMLVLPAGLAVEGEARVPRLPATGVSGIRGSASEKGSVLFWPVVEVKWDASGRLIQDTLLSLVNDVGEDVRVLLYFVQGDPPFGEVCNPVCPRIAGRCPPGCLVERGHEGWNHVDVEFTVTANQPVHWSALSGEPANLSPWTILDPGDPPGRPDTDPRNQYGRMLRGFVVGWAVNGSGREVNWNHLAGTATVAHYADGTAWDYNSWNLQCVSDVALGEECDAVPGRLGLNGKEYDALPDRLLYDFYAVGSAALSHPSARR
jgi:hypothetical protein